MPSYKKQQNKKDLVERLIKEGKSKKEIAEIAEIPFNSLTHYFKMWGFKIFELRPKKINKPHTRKSRYDLLEVDVRKLVAEGIPLRDICEKTSIPLGSIGYLLDKWGLTGQTEQNRGSRFTPDSYKRVIDGVKKSHVNGNRVHHFLDLFRVHNEWLNEEAAREEYQFFVDQDLKLSEMASLAQVDQKTVTNHLKRLGLQQGPRREKRHYNFKGYVKRYRGADWLPNRELALERDGYKCTKCGKTREEEKAMTKRDLHVHHLVPWVECQTNIVDNLITVCESCHKAIHTGELSTVNLGIK